MPFEARRELWRGCGELVVLDLVLNNYDRFPAVWSNVGNTANVFYLQSGEAVSFLWRFPSGCPARALPGTVVSGSPDFPRGGLMPQRGHPALCARSAYACIGAASRWRGWEGRCPSARTRIHPRIFGVRR